MRCHCPGVEFTVFHSVLSVHAGIACTEMISEEGKKVAPGWQFFPADRSGPDGLQRTPTPGGHRPEILFTNKMIRIEFQD